MPVSRSADLLDPDDRRSERRDWLANREIPAALGSHKEAAQYFQADAELVDAVNVSLAVGAPLLLTGEPGTGKTQVAHYLAWFFDIELFPLFVRSNTTAEDLLYRFDAVAYLHAANVRGEDQPSFKKSDHVHPGPLWLAYDEMAERGKPAVVLIDEIDKAPRDFPNDLLNVLDQHEFTVRETGEKVNRRGHNPPLVVITSNSERRLPEPFLRRCLVHHLELTEELLRRAVAARQGDFPNLAEPVREKAIERFLDLRGHELRKKPATAELLVWLFLLASRGITQPEQLDGSLRDLPFVQALIKDRDDYLLLP